MCLPILWTKKQEPLQIAQDLEKINRNRQLLVEATSCCCAPVTCSMWSVALLVSGLQLLVRTPFICCNRCELKDPDDHDPYVRGYWNKASEETITDANNNIITFNWMMWGGKINDLPTSHRPRNWCDLSFLILNPTQCCNLDGGPFHRGDESNSEIYYYTASFKPREVNQRPVSYPYLFPEEIRMMEKV